MSAEENKPVVRRFVEELWNKRNLDVADGIFAADCVTHQLSSGSPLTATPRDPETVKKHVLEWLSSFPDLTFSIEQMIAEGDRVASQLIMRGTHTGVWLGIAPTGIPVSIRMFTIHRIANGKIAEDWVLVEALGLFQQLGVVESTEQILAAAAQ